jgi:hypothetical protein
MKVYISRPPSIRNIRQQPLCEKISDLWEKSKEMDLRKSELKLRVVLSYLFL